MDAPRDRGEHALNADPAHQLRLLDLQALDSRLDALADNRAGLPRSPSSPTATETIGRRGPGRDPCRCRPADQGAGEGGRGRRRRTHARAGPATPRRRRGRSAGTRIAGAPARTSVTGAAARRARGRRARDHGAAGDGPGPPAGARARRARRRARGRAVREAATTTGRRSTPMPQRPPRSAPTSPPTLPIDLLALYEKLRAQIGGVGAAATPPRRCDGCRLQILHRRTSPGTPAPDRGRPLRGVRTDPRALRSPAVQLTPPPRRRGRRGVARQPGAGRVRRGAQRRRTGERDRRDRAGRSASRPTTSRSTPG